MNDTYIVTTFVVIDDILTTIGYQDDCRSQLQASEIMTIAAKYFQNHHERALHVLVQLGYVPAFSMSRFNRRLHLLLDWFDNVLHLLAYLAAQRKLFIIDSSPLPVCRKQLCQR